MSPMPHRCGTITRRWLIALGLLLPVLARRPLIRRSRKQHCRRSPHDRGRATYSCGYPFAYFLSRKSGRFKGLFLVLFFAPFCISYMLRMLSWQSLLLDNGYVNQILTGLALFMTFFVMSTTIEQSYASGIKPYLDGQLAGEVALDRHQVAAQNHAGADPRNDLQLFTRLSGKTQFP
jgi:hypothetical protein